MPVGRTGDGDAVFDGAPVPGGGGVAEVPKGGGRGDGRRRNVGRGGGGAGGADSEAESVHSSAVPKSGRLCIKHLWGKCPDPEDKCQRGSHKIPDSIPNALRENTFFKKMLKEHGEPDIKS